MYNTDKIRKFMKMIDSAAEKAAQEVYNRNEETFKKLVESEIEKGSDIYCGMGTAIQNINGNISYKNESFVNLISTIQYTNIQANFSIEKFENL